MLKSKLLLTLNQTIEDAILESELIIHLNCIVLGIFKIVMDLPQF